MIKEQYETFDSIIKNEDDIIDKEINNNTHFYYKKSRQFPPDWIRKFFEGSLGECEEDFKVSSARGILLRKVQIQNETKIFALIFGHGRFLLNSFCIEERFGLKTVLSIINVDNIRKIDKKDISNVPKYSIEQRSKVGSRLDFGINIEQDLIKGVTGFVKEGYRDIFGDNVAGADAINLSARYNIENIDDLLSISYSRYKSGDYKEDFGWIDQIAPVKNPELIKKLDDILINKIKQSQQNQKIWMSVPEIIEWDIIIGFKYNFSDDEESKSDIFLQDFYDSLDDETQRNLDLSVLKSKEICAIDSDGNEKNIWKAYECIYAEIEYDEKIYLLSNSSWFEIENDFVHTINTSYNEFVQKDLNGITSLMNAKEVDGKLENEGNYNERIAEEQELILLDRQNIQYGGRHSKIEFCDLLTNNNEIIHIKKYGGSSVLSHLFFQGLNSAELFKSDEPFVQKVNKKLPEDRRFDIPIQASDYKIIFGVISEVNGDLNLPFFSKIALKTVKQRLENLGYNVYMQKIDVTHGVRTNE